MKVGSHGSTALADEHLRPAVLLDVLHPPDLGPPARHVMGVLDQCPHVLRAGVDLAAAARDRHQLAYSISVNTSRGARRCLPPRNESSIRNAHAATSAPARSTSSH